MGKRDHLKDYVPTEDGGYEYVGTHWSWPSPDIRAGFLRRCPRPSRPSRGASLLPGRARNGG